MNRRLRRSPLVAARRHARTLAVAVLLVGSASSAAAARARGGIPIHGTPSPTRAATDPAAPAADEYYGLNVQELFRLTPVDQWDARLSSLYRSGIRVIRKDAFWSSVEPVAPDGATGAHDYRWAQMDSYVAAMARNGLRYYPIINHTAPWAANGPVQRNTPPRPELFAEWSAAVVRRYGRGGEFWRQHPGIPAKPAVSFEIWNEPNFDRFWQGTDPKSYADVFAAAQKAILRIDPKAQVVIGGLVDWNADTYLRAVVRHRPELARSIRAVGLHPYRDAEYFYPAIARFRRVMDKLGMSGAAIELTEFGWTTKWTTERERAAQLGTVARELPCLFALGVTRMMPHTYVTQERDPMNGEHWFGLWNGDGTPKPAGRAYAAAASAGSRCTPARAAHVARAFDARFRRRPSRASADQRDWR